MNSLKTAALTVCTALVTLGVLRQLAPEGRMRRGVEIAFGLATVIAIAIPLSGGIRLGNSALTKPSADQSSAAQIAQISESQNQAILAEVLASAEVEYSDIVLKMDISDEGGIYINCVKIAGVPDAQADRARLAAAAALGIDSEDVEVICE